MTAVRFGDWATSRLVNNHHRHPHATPDRRLRDKSNSAQFRYDSSALPHVTQFLHLPFTSGPSHASIPSLINSLPHAHSLTWTELIWRRKGGGGVFLEHGQSWVVVAPASTFVVLHTDHMKASLYKNKNEGRKYSSRKDRARSKEETNESTRMRLHKYDA